MTRSSLPAWRLAARTTSVSPIAEPPSPRNQNARSLGSMARIRRASSGSLIDDSAPRRYGLPLEHLGRGAVAGHVAAAVGGHELVVLALGDALEAERAQVHVVRGIVGAEVGLPALADLGEGQALVGPEVVAAGVQAEDEILELVGRRAGGLLSAPARSTFTPGSPR